jgi:transposase
MTTLDDDLEARCQCQSELAVWAQLNAAIHRIALTQAHWHPPAKAIIARRRANGDGGLEALRVLKRLSDVVYRALRADLTATLAEAA